MYNLNLKNMERYKDEFKIEDNKILKATEHALEYLEKSLDRFTDKFPKVADGYCHEFDKGFSNNRYIASDKITWTTSLWTGVYWLAYQLSGNVKFRIAAENHVNICVEAAANGQSMGNHDTGFKFTPSCVAAYKITGNEKARAAALTAAKHLMNHYCPENHFILRGGNRRPEDSYDMFRILDDTMLNIPLLFWAHQETGDKTYLDAAVGHYRATSKYLVREDGSSYHHYQFDPINLTPVKGLTHQGRNDESCWTRGHSWLVYGYPVAYNYTGDKEIFDVHKAVSYYFLDNLPNDYIPYWDFDFKDGSFEPRDSSAAAIAVCGLLEMCRHLPAGAEEINIYKNASNLMLDALIDKCANKDEESDGLISHVTLSKPHSMGIDTIATYGDYFYLEALMRMLKPEWSTWW